MRSSMQSFHEKLKTWDTPLPDLGLRASLLTIRPRLNINRLSRQEDLNETIEGQESSSPSDAGGLVRSDSIFMLHENAAVSISEGINYSEKKHLKQSFVLGAQEQKATVPLIWKSWTSPDLKHTRNDHAQRSRHSVHVADGLPPKVNRSRSDKSAEEKQLAHHADKVRPKSPRIDAGKEQIPTQPNDSTKHDSVSEDEFDLSTELSESESETVEEADHSHPFPPRVSSLAYSKQHAAAVRALQTGSEVPSSTTTPFNHSLPASDFELSKEAVSHEARTAQATGKADTPQQEGSESQISSRDTSTVAGTQPYSAQSRQLSKQIEKMLTFMTNGHTQERSTGKRTVERTRLLDTHVGSRDNEASSLPSAHGGKMTNGDDDCQKLKGKRSFWRIGNGTNSAHQADKHKSEMRYLAVERNGSIDANGHHSIDRDVYDIINTINTIRCDREVKPLEYCERLCAEAQEVATAHDLQAESAALYSATPDLSSGSAMWFDDEASTAVLVGPTGFDGLTTADIWMQGKEPRHDQRNHKRVVDDAILLEHCACYNHKMYVAIVDELWSRVGMARTKTDERWVVIVGEEVAKEDLLPQNVSSKKTVIKRKPLPQHPYAAEYGVMSPYEWDPDEDAERDTVAGSSRPD